MVLNKKYKISASQLNGMSHSILTKPLLFALMDEVTEM